MPGVVQATIVYPYRFITPATAELKIPVTSSLKCSCTLRITRWKCRCHGTPAGGTVYTERDAAESAAFHALLDEVKRSEVHAVVVPTMNHLGFGSPGGTPAAMRQHLEFHQAQVWAADSR